MTSHTYHVLKDILLMHMNGDERLKLGPLDLGELLRGAVDEHAEQLAELLARVLHDLLVGARVAQRDLGVTRPQHLDAQQTDLQKRQTRR